MTATAGLPPLSLEDKFTVDEGKIYLTGVQALVRVPLVQRRADLARGHNASVAVEMNLQAFRRGRQWVADPDALAAAVAAAAPQAATEVSDSPAARRIGALVHAEPGSELERLVGIRVPLLIAYQNAAYAERYARRVERVRAAEGERTVGRTDIAEAVAFNLHKLMAYKDEYEVARLHLDDSLRRDIEGRFGSDASFAFMLHPPILNALGMNRKIKIPGKAGIAMFKALAPMKRLRHTPLDPFGRDHVRAVERELIREYEALVDEIADRLSEGNHDIAVDLAGLPDMVRGYDEIKLRNVELYHEQVARLRPRLTDGRSRQGSLPVASLRLDRDTDSCHQNCRREVAVGLARRLTSVLTHVTGRSGVQNSDNLERDEDVEGHLDPNTAALMEGAPLGGSGGGVQPSGTSPDPRPPRGPGEGDVQNLPG